MKAHPLLTGSLVAMPLAASLAILANAIELGALASLLLLCLSLLIPITLALELAARRDGRPTRLSKTAHGERPVNRHARS